jgi:hypothetical protein
MEDIIQKKVKEGQPIDTNDLRLLHQELLYRIHLKKKEFDASDNHHYEGLLQYTAEIWSAHNRTHNPIIYFGLLIIHYPDLALSPRLINSKYAKVFVYKKYIEIAESGENIIGHIENEYKRDVGEQILHALKLGEDHVEHQQVIRKLSRMEALEFCARFNNSIHIPDIYFLACKEFPKHSIRLLRLQPDLFKTIEKNFGSLRSFKRSKNAKLLKNVSDSFYAERWKGRIE